MNKKMLCLIVGIALNFLFILNAEAAEHYVRAGATGNGNDWTNAYGSLPATLIRGDTYYIARGSYPGMSFNTPASGTLLITIKGATAADHGTDVGWTNSYSVSATDGGSQAIWTSGVSFTTSYWVFDGSAGPLWSRTPSQYGFTFNSMSFPVKVYNTSAPISNITIAHIAATAPSADTEKVFVRTDNSTKSVNNVTISHNYLNGWQNAYMATSPGATMDTWIFQYNIVLNGFSSSANHGEDVNNNYGYMTNQITCYNWFEGRTSGTGVIVANNNTNTNAKIYGNVFKNMTAGNGIISGTSAGNLVSPVVYNNTFINCTSGGWIGGQTTGTPVVNNNLLYNMSGARQVSNTDYNAYFSVSGAPSEPHGLIASGSPFVNETANDLTLKAPIAAGIPLPAPYNVDAFGNTQEAGGSWDRGALQYVPTGTAPAPSPIEPPSNLRL